MFLRPVTCHQKTLCQMGKKSKKEEGAARKWKTPSIKDLQRAALGPHADSIPDEELDEFAAR